MTLPISSANANIAIMIVEKQVKVQAHHNLSFFLNLQNIKSQVTGASFVKMVLYKILVIFSIHKKL